MSGLLFCPEAPIEPTTFDLIVIGTGIPGSVIAAAASAVGKTVLHLDPNPFYGSHFASLPPNDLTSFLNSHSTDHITTATTINTTTSIDPSVDHDYIAIDLKPRLLYSNIETAAYAPEILEKHCPKEFTIDLGGPRLLFPADKATELLMKSGLNLYVECGFLVFNSVGAIFVCDESGQLRNIPHSRIELFKDRSLSLKEKTMLTRFFKFLEHYLEASRGIGGDQEGSHNSESSKISEEELETPFVDFINRMQLPPKIKLIIHCIAMVDQDDLEVCKSKLKTRDGLERLALYHSSRSTNAHGPWIYPKYGHGDLSAAFARRAAVKGCIDALERPVIAVLMDKDSGQYKGVRLASGQDLFSHQLVLDPTFTVTLAPTSSPPNLLRADLQVLSLKDDKGKVARGICITASSLKPDISNCVLVCPPRSLCPDQDTSIRIIQICGGLETGVCPKGMFLLYFSALCDNAEQGKRLLHAVQNALLTLPMSGNPERASTVQSEKAEVKPTLLWSTLYIQELTMDQHDYLISTPMPDGNLCYNDLLDATVLLFQKLYPNEEFFPETPSLENLEDDIPINLED